MKSQKGQRKQRNEPYSRVGQEYSSFWVNHMVREITREEPKEAKPDTVVIQQQTVG